MSNSKAMYLDLNPKRTTKSATAPIKIMLMRCAQQKYKANPSKHSQNKSSPNPQERLKSLKSPKKKIIKSGFFIHASPYKFILGKTLELWAIKIISSTNHTTIKIPNAQFSFSGFLNTIKIAARLKSSPKNSMPFLKIFVGLYSKTNYWINKNI